MKISSAYKKAYSPHHDTSCDPEDRSSHLYHSHEDNILEQLAEKYCKVAKMFLLVRDSSLTTIEVDRPLRTQLDNKRDYEVTVSVTTEGKSDAKHDISHPKELTDLIYSKDFKKQ